MTEKERTQLDKLMDWTRPTARLDTDGDPDPSVGRLANVGAQRGQSAAPRSGAAADRRGGAPGEARAGTKPAVCASRATSSARTLVVRAMRDPAPRVALERLRAARSLAERDRPGVEVFVQEQLAPMLRTGAEPRLRLAALEAAVELSANTQTVTQLIDIALQDNEPAIRERAREPQLTP